MAENMHSIIEVRVDLSEIDGNFKELIRETGTIQTLISNLNKVIWTGIDTLNGINAGVENNGTLVKTFLSVLKGEVKECTTQIVTGLKNITLAVGKVEQAQEHEPVSSTLNNALGAIDSGTNIWEKYKEKTSEKDTSTKNGHERSNHNGYSTYTNKKGQLLLPAAGESSYGKNFKNGSSASGIVSSGLADLGNSFPDAAEMEGLAESIGNVAGKLKETAIQWGLELKAKALSRAEDLKIIAINTVEHVKAFGMMISQLALSAGAWIAETAAKVANTAAQWAQIAATTAWQAICVAATAVTTAFGAAVVLEQ